MLDHHAVFMSFLSVFEPIDRLWQN